MSFTKTVFFAPLSSAQITAVVPAADGSLSQILDDTLQVDEGVALTAGKTFQLLNGFYSSPRLKFNDIVSFKQTVQSDGTAQIIKLNIVEEEDDTAYVKLIDVTDGREKFSIKTFESSGSTPAINHAALVTSIAADDNVATVTGTSPELIIAFVKDVVYRAAANNASSAINYHTAMVHSVGKAAEVKAALAEGMAFKGVTNQGGSNIVSPGFAAAVDCDKTVIEVVTTVGDRKDRHEIVVYAGEGGATDKLYQNLAAIFANV